MAQESTQTKSRYQFQLSEEGCSLSFLTALHVIISVVSSAFIVRCKVAILFMTKCLKICFPVKCHYLVLCLTSVIILPLKSKATTMEPIDDVLGLGCYLLCKNAMWLVNKAMLLMFVYNWQLNFGNHAINYLYEMLSAIY